MSSAWLNILSVAYTFDHAPQISETEWKLPAATIFFFHISFLYLICTLRYHFLSPFFFIGKESRIDAFNKCPISQGHTTKNKTIYRLPSTHPLRITWPVNIPAIHTLCSCSWSSVRLRNHLWGRLRINTHFVCSLIPDILGDSGFTSCITLFITPLSGSPVSKWDLVESVKQGYILISAAKHTKAVTQLAL